VVILIIGGTTLTAFEGTAGASTAIIDGVTLSIGGSATTIGSEIVSLGSSGVCYYLLGRLGRLG
jgi:hypothetical protein